MNETNPLAWEKNFPSVYMHTSISYLKKCSGFNDAKQGDSDAAQAVANKCINPSVIKEIRRKHPDSILLPVITANKLPEAFANTIGMKTHTEVHERKSVNRKTLTAMQRLLHKPEFYGDITSGESYIIIDDIITQGGTVSALRKHVIRNGGHVTAISALSCSAGSNILAPTEHEVHNLASKFCPLSIEDTLEHYSITQDLRELTRAQIRYLLRFKNAECLVRKIEDAQTARNAQSYLR